ncbi:hypothetical protein DFS34DRAFT_594727 [Phlyctochytrium arcticum]|nr:hypothetical protein DFS34DRAFT_594727 [Phlyctochytrium arcticum]
MQNLEIAIVAELLDFSVVVLPSIMAVHLYRKWKKDERGMKPQFRKNAVALLASVALGQFFNCFAAPWHTYTILQGQHDKVGLSLETADHLAFLAFGFANFFNDLSATIYLFTLLERFEIFGSILRFSPRLLPALRKIAVALFVFGFSGHILMWRPFAIHTWKQFFFGSWLYIHWLTVIVVDVIVSSLMVTTFRRIHRQLNDFERPSFTKSQMMSIAASPSEFLKSNYVTPGLEPVASAHGNTTMGEQSVAGNTPTGEPGSPHRPNGSGPRTDPSKNNLNATAKPLDPAKEGRVLLIQVIVLLAIDGLGCMMYALPILGFTSYENEMIPIIHVAALVVKGILVYLALVYSPPRFISVLDASSFYDLQITSLLMALLAHGWLPLVTAGYTVPVH